MHMELAEWLMVDAVGRVAPHGVGRMVGALDSGNGFASSMRIAQLSYLP